MPKTSAGLLMYKTKPQLQVFLAHPGGPFFRNKDVWGIPKGELNGGEEPMEAAKREFREETGIEPKGPFISLGSIRQASGKIVHGWAFEGDWSGLLLGTSYVNLEYPAKSGKFVKFPEIDKASFFTIEKAKKKINKSQAELLKRLQDYLKNNRL
ncbi:MAG: NUDIX domain-containing protein [Candidatus Nanoarchaeia archaeon]|nr:NUDIX domain-containing protein [Candidatus Nanoarchaeia archaeon]